MNRQPLLTKRSLTHGSARFLMSAALLESALLVASCSDGGSSGGTPTFTTTSDTSSSTAPSTTTPVTPNPPVTPPTPPSVTPTSTTSTTGPVTSTTSSASSSAPASSETSGPAGTTLDEASSTPGESADTAATTVEVPTLVLEDAGADASVSEDTADTSEPAATSDTAAPVEVDASVTDDEATTDVGEVTSEPEATTDQPAVTSDDVPTSDPASSSAEVTSDSPYGPELITNPGFEGDSTAGWAAFSAGGVTISAENTYSNSGTYSGLATGRTDTWHGISTNLIATATPDTTYHVEASVRVSVASAPVKLTFAFSCNGAGATYHDGATGTANNTGWTDLSGNATLPACATTVTQLVFYVQGPPTGVDIYIDDVSVREVL